MVSEIFMTEKARNICSIVISLSLQRNRLVWVGNKNGEYTVMSGYHFAKKKANKNERTSSDSSNLSQLLNVVWNFKGPRALKMFLWRVCNKILLAKENLYKRKNDTDSKCPIYSNDIETLGHIIWSCLVSRDVWPENVMSIQKRTSDEIEFCELFGNL